MNAQHWLYTKYVVNIQHYMKKPLCSCQQENKILHSIIQFPCKKTQTFSFPVNHKFIHYVTAYFDSLVPNKI